MPYCSPATSFTRRRAIRLPGTPVSYWLTYVEGDEVHADAGIDDYGAAGNRLCINRGLGIGLLPLRSNCAPAIALFALTASELLSLSGPAREER